MLRAEGERESLNPARSARLGSSFDIVSGGELERLRRIGVSGRRIVFSGVGKTREEIRTAIHYRAGSTKQHGILLFNVESAAELDVLIEEAALHVNRQRRGRRRRLPGGDHRDPRRDIAFADRLGYVVKLLAVAELFATAGPTSRSGSTRRWCPAHHPLASVRGRFNAVFIEGEAAGELMLYGRGAGRPADGQRRAR